MAWEIKPSTETGIYTPFIYPRQGKAYSLALLFRSDINDFNQQYPIKEYLSVDGYIAIVCISIINRFLGHDVYEVVLH